MGNEVIKKIIKKIDKLTNQWSIYIPSVAINKELKEQLEKVRAKVHIDGFRNGKAPLEIVEKRYGEEALYKAVNSIVHKTITEIVEEGKYKLAMSPEISFNGETFKKDEDVTIKVKIVQKPKIPEIKYDKVKFDVYELELSDSEKEEEMNNFRNKMAKQKLVEIDRPVNNGDAVDIDFVGKTADDNTEFSGGSAKGYKLEIGSNSFIEGFEKQIIGHKKGETFDINVTFPEEYHVSTLKGKKAIFTITINDIYEKELPELTDEFAKTLGFESLEKVRSLLFDNVKNVFESNEKQLLKGKVFDAVIEQNKFDLPENAINDEIEDKVSREAEEAKKNDDKKFNEKKVRQHIHDSLYKSYASFYLTDYIAEKNAIEVSEDEVKQVATQDAIRNGMNIKDVLDRLKNDSKLYNYISYAIKETKVFEFIYDRIKKNVKKLDRKSFEKYLEDERKKLAENK